MHILRDENGNLIPHGDHEHHDHDEHHTSCSHDGGHKDETQALLSYMIQHNESHAREIEDMAADLENKGFAEVAEKMREGVAEFAKGNACLHEALEHYEEHLKEE